MNHSNIIYGEIVGTGIDVPLQRRPGVPMETPPHSAAGAHWKTPENQPVHGEILLRSDLAAPTPVFGTAQPPHGLSGLIRRYAYRIPDHKPKHWAALFLADRLDVAECALADLFRRKPLVVAGGCLLLAGTGIGLALVVRRPRQQRLRFHRHPRSLPLPKG